MVLVSPFLKMNQFNSLEFENYLHIIGCSYDIFLVGDFYMSFSNKNMKGLCGMVKLNHLINPFMTEAVII